MSRLTIFLLVSCALADMPYQTTIEQWRQQCGARVDEDCCWFLHGRADESMNVAGRKVCPAEVEDALMEHPAVVESAVIGVPDEMTGDIVGFVVLKKDFDSTEPLRKAIAKQIVESLGPTFRPNAIHFVPAVPKTQSGKVVRRLICQFQSGCSDHGDNGPASSTIAIK